MTIKNDLNQKELIAKLAAIGTDVKVAQKEISETIKNKLLWFRIGDTVATYDARRKKKWCLMYR